MKKRGILLISILILSITNVSASSFKIDVKKYSSFDNKNDNVLNNNKYIIDSDSKNDSEFIDLAKKTTYLLLGDFNNENESSISYYNRHKEFLNLGFKETKDENSDEYIYYLFSSSALKSVFLQLNNLGVIYNSYGNIKISHNNDIVVANLYIPNVKIKELDSDNYSNTYVDTNLVLYYYFKKEGNSYKLYYLYGNTTDNIDKYIKENEKNELSYLKKIISYDSFYNSIYDYSNFINLNDDTINNIYNSNINNLVYLNTYYNNNIVEISNGFYLTNNIVLTSYNYLLKSLVNGQYIAIKDNNNNIYKVEDIVTVVPEYDIALLKVKDNTTHISLADSFNINDSTIVIGSKTGISYNTYKGIILDDDLNISIPSDDNLFGSVVFDSNGLVLGVVNNKSIGNSSSITSFKVLKTLQDEYLNKNDFETISFSKLKENYYSNIKKEISNNNISSKVWNKYKNVGDIENSIKLKTVKINYSDNVLSIRYKNSIEKYIDNMSNASLFIDNLIQSGFYNSVDEDDKKVYENSKYKVVIISEFDYLIVVMVRK